jgi:hypothetical protein
MQKLISIFTIIFLLACSQAYAGNCVASKAGNWSDVTVWGASCNGSTNAVPVADDVVNLNGYAIVFDYATAAKIPATGRLGQICSTDNVCAGTATGGTITFDVDTGTTTCDTEDTCAIYFTTGQTGTEHLFQITGTSAAGQITIDGTSCTASAATANKHCIYHNSANTIHSDITPVGGSGNGGDGINIASSGDVNLSKGATGGGFAGAYGVSNGGNAAAVVTVTAGTVTGGTNVSAAGISNFAPSASNVVVESAVLLVNGSLGSAISGSFTWNAAAGSNSYWKIGDLYLSPAPAKTKVTSDQSIVIYNTGNYEAGTAATGGGGAYAY